jgi:hypothetical protein
MIKTRWLDDEHLFEYATHDPWPSEIQRLACEFYYAMRTKLDTEVLIRFIRRN